MTCWSEQDTAEPTLPEFVVASGRVSALIRGVAQHPLRSIRRPTVAVLLAVTIAASACTSRHTTQSETAQQPNKSAAPLSSTTILITSAEDELSAAVRAFWDLYLALGTHTGPFDSSSTRTQLAERTTGDELRQLVRFFAANGAAGLAVRGEIDVAPHVLSVDGDTAQVRDCYDDRTGLYRVIDGGRVDTDDPLRHQVLMTFIREDSLWKVSAIREEGNGCVV